MSSYKLQAKNKKTGEIVEVIRFKNYYGVGGYGYQIETGKDRYGTTFNVFREKEFNELYEVIDTETVMKEVTDKWEKQALEASGLDNAPVEDWEEKFDKKFYAIVPDQLIVSEDYDIYSFNNDPKDKSDLDDIKQFIKQTLQKEKERIVRDINQLQNPFIDDKFTHNALEEARETIIKLIQNK